MNPKKINTYTCRVCKAKYERKMGNTWCKWCSEECQDIYIKQVLEKERKKAWKKKKEQYKKELGIKPKQSQDQLQKKINKIAVLLDKDQPCLAKPFDDNSRFEAGHVYGVGRCPALRYNLWNIHKQGSYSNRSQTDDQLMIEGIELRYGKEKREELEQLRRDYPVLKLTKPEKMAALKRANEILNRLNDGEEMTRDYINDYLNIYKED